MVSLYHIPINSMDLLAFAIAMPLAIAAWYSMRRLAKPSSKSLVDKVQTSRDRPLGGQEVALTS
jgi:hypothetical protein